MLSEIRRIVRELGHAPGKREFLARTGIKESDWSGRYWARWSDALAEAGFEPNKLQRPHSEQHLLESLARLTRELGGFPTTPEMRLKRRSDSSFPNEKTFERFGKRSALVAHVRKYCTTAGGYDDVVGFCDATLASASKTSGRTQREVPARAFSGYVYMIKCGKNQYKIGRTNSPLRRHREIRLDVPFPTNLVHSISTDDPAGIEAYWRDIRFRDKRIDGTQEFFKLDASDVTAFKRRKFM